MKNLWMILLAAVLFSSCEKDGIIPCEACDLETVVIEMGPEYDTHHYFDLGVQSVTKVTENDVWDLAFDTDEMEFGVYLNSSRFMAAYQTSETKFDLVTTSSVDEASWTYDRISGEIENLAIGNWGFLQSSTATGVDENGYISKGTVFIIHLGKDEAGEDIGFKKLQLLGFSDGNYSVRFANLDGTEDHTVEIKKDVNYDRMYLTFNDGGRIVDVAPIRSEWDMVFTQYTSHLLYQGNELPYLVRGFLLNGTQSIGVAEDSVTAFEDFTLEIASSMSFSRDNDAIGFDWKSYSISESVYSVKDDKVYVIKDRNGDYHKLRFVDFLNEEFQRGYPKFELQKL